MYEVSSGGIAFTKSFEGFRATPYGDAGQLDIGYGHKNDEGYSYISEEDASVLLQMDLNDRLNSLYDVMGMNMNQNQVDACADLMMSISPAYVRQSEIPSNVMGYLLKRISKEEFSAWWLGYRDTINGIPNDNLKNRRAKELELFMKTDVWQVVKTILTIIITVGFILSLFYFIEIKK